VGGIISGEIDPWGERLVGKTPRSVFAKKMVVIYDAADDHACIAASGGQRVLGVRGY